MSAEKLKTPLILFDPDCALCVRFKQAMEHMSFDCDISFTPYENPYLLERFPTLKNFQLSKEVHLVVDDSAQTVLVGEQVIEFLVKHNPKARKLAWLLESNVGEKASHYFYKSVNKLRESLQHHCSNCRK
jgi:predicted DCC family thiol-disulfide oxidoreductase YuxK